MHVLLALTYYRPHLSGLTLYVERLARALAARGHGVTVLAAHHDPSTPNVERLDGVEVVRVPVAATIGKGAVMPTFLWHAARLARRHDVVSVHTPQLDGPLAGLAARLAGRPVVVTHHCDLHLPGGAVNRVAERAIRAADLATGALADRVVAYTGDYAAHSAVLRRFPRRLEVIAPPVLMPPPAPAAVDVFRRTHGLLGVDGRPLPAIGMAARLATEKGVEVLLAAAPALLERFAGLRLLFAGPYADVPGEAVYRERLRPAIDALGERWRFLGPLDPAAEMPAYLAALDCLLVPSVNSTESFGLVQVEAMLCGTPVGWPSDLPGVPPAGAGHGMGGSPRRRPAPGRGGRRLLEVRGPPPPVHRDARR